MYSNFMLLDRFLFELSCKNTHTQTRTHTHTHTRRDSNEYPIVAFSKNTTIMIAAHKNNRRSVISCNQPGHLGITMVQDN